MANVTQHAYRDGDGELLVSATAHPDRLDIAVADHGRWRTLQHKTHGGMGRALIHGLADHAEINTDDGGTIVSMMWFHPDDDHREHSDAELQTEQAGPAGHAVSGSEVPIPTPLSFHFRSDPVSLAEQRVDQLGEDG